MFQYGKPVAMAAMLALGASMLAACGGPTGLDPQSAALLGKPVPKAQARLKIFREDAALGGMQDARVKIDGRDIQALAPGEIRVVDVPAGAHQLIVDHWGHPNVFKLDLQAKAGTQYELRISQRGEAAVAGMFGLTGMLIEAAANENGGTYEIQLVKQGPVS